jgi:hypothetical protein
MTGKLLSGNAMTMPWMAVLQLLHGPTDDLPASPMLQSPRAHAK